MPAGNGTGPMGMGPLSGRGMGYCAGFGVPGYANPGGVAFGRGRGCGGGSGRGFGGGGYGRRNVFMATGVPGWQRAGGAWAQPGPAAEAQVLEQRATALQNELEAVRGRLDTLKSTKPE